MKKILLSALAVVAMTIAQAQTTVNLSGNDWQFFYAKTSQVGDSLMSAGFGRMDYQAKGFQQTPVPSNWAVLGYEEPVYRGYAKAGDQASEGFYVKKFTLPAAFKGKRVVLHFGGVWNSAEVWLNGVRLGLHESGYTSFSFNATGNIKADSINTLAVRVRQVYPGYKTDTYDDWTLVGIYRDVTLEAMPRKQWIEKVTAVTHFDKDYRDADLDIRAIVANTEKNTLPGNYSSPGTDYQLRLQLLAADGSPVCTENVTVKGHVSTSKETRRTLHLKAPRQWTAETPYLYILKVEMMGKDGKPAHTWQERIGVREISTKDGVFRINGQAVKLRGVNRHDEWPTVGRAVGRQHWLEDLQKMKDANINYVRACHYQHAKGFIEMCDSIGMYVGAEVSLGGAGTMMYDPSFVSPVMLRVQETVERDLNNPCIVYWSVGNEDPFTYMHLRAIRAVKGIDQTRPCLMPWNANEELPEEVDILAPHYWTSYEYDSICAQSKRPVITTEYVHAYGLQRFGGLEDCFKAIHKHPAGAGGAVWMWADQGIATPVKKDREVYRSLAKDDDYLRLDAAGWDGITDSYRRPTRDLWEVKAVYLPVYPDVDSIRVGKSAKTVEIPIRNDYDFRTIDDIDIQYQVFVDDRLVSSGTGWVDAAPHTTANLDISLKGMGQLKTDETAYVQFVFKRADGEEMGRRSVELLSERERERVRRQVLKATDANGHVVITAGEITIDFDRQTGLPVQLRPTIWHSLNDGDQIIKNRKFEKGADPEHAMPAVRSMTVSEEPGRVIVHSTVDYTIDSQNYFSADYVCTVDETGRLSVDYTIRPEVQMNFLPVVGMVLQLSSADDMQQWLGLGPDDNYPNKHCATILGVYDARQLTGTRQARWLDLQSNKGVKTRIEVNGYIDRDKTTSKEVRILSQVLGRAEKGRLNDRNYRVLPTDTFHGHLAIWQKQ